MIHNMVEMVPTAQPIVATPTVETILILQILTTVATTEAILRKTLIHWDANACPCQERVKSSYARTFR
jgi:hypothetical protein